MVAAAVPSICERSPATAATQYTQSVLLRSSAPAARATPACTLALAVASRGDGAGLSLGEPARPHLCGPDARHQRAGGCLWTPPYAPAGAAGARRARHTVPARCPLSPPHLLFEHGAGRHARLGRVEQYAPSPGVLRGLVSESMVEGVKASNASLALLASCLCRPKRCTLLELAVRRFWLAVLPVEGIAAAPSHARLVAVAALLLGTKPAEDAPSDVMGSREFFDLLASPRSRSARMCWMRRRRRRRTFAGSPPCRARAGLS